MHFKTVTTTPFFSTVSARSESHVYVVEGPKSALRLDLEHYNHEHGRMHTFGPIVIFWDRFYSAIAWRNCIL